MKISELGYEDFRILIDKLRPVIGFSIFNCYIVNGDSMTIKYDRINVNNDSPFIFGKPGKLKITEEKLIKLFYELGTS
jgi:hypothetical protein